MAKNLTIPAYISGFPKDAQPHLKAIYKTIQGIVPKETVETIGYGIATFKLHGNLVHFGGFKKHIGFFPCPTTIVAFKKELKDYASSKGTVQFPFDQPLPLALIKKMTKWRVAENRAEAKMKEQAKKTKKKR